MTTDSPPPHSSLWRWLPWLSPLVLGAALVAGWQIAQQASAPDAAVGTSAPGAVSLPLPSELPPAQPANLLEAADDSSQVVLPKGWEPESTLNPQAQIQAANREQQMYLVVRAQPKQDLGDLTLEEFSRQSRQLLTQRLTQVEETGPSDRLTQVGEFPALQYEIRGSLNQLGVVYLHTTVETPDYFTQILTWTAPADFARNQAAMQALIQTVELQ